MAINKRLYWETRIDNKKLVADAARTQAVFTNLSKSVRKVGLFGAAGIGGAIIVKEFVKVNAVFEKSMSTLSSLTGAVGDDLDFYKTKAIEFGEVTTQSASQVAEAFKLVGSQKPELLATGELLADVTKKAITLAEAADIDVTTAAKALTLSLNQTGKSAEYAAEYINILAAGSLKGAGDIPYINQAIEKTGKVATDANLSFAEMVAVIESLAPAISEPSSAGLHMNQVLLRLQKNGYGFSTGMFDLQEALNAVKDELDGIKDPSKRASKEIAIFGTRSITAGKVMLENRDKFKQFADTISGTETAYEQAKINTDNLQGSWIKLKSALEGAILKNSEINGSLKNLVDGLTDTVRWVGENWEWIEKLIKTYLVYVGVVKGTAIAMRLYNSITKISTILTKGFNKAMKANMIGLLVAGVFAAIEAFKYFNKEVEKQTQLQKDLNYIAEETSNRLDKETGKMMLLIDLAEDETRSKQQRKKAIEELNKITPKYIGQITEETVATGKARKAIDGYVESIGKKIRAQLAEEKIFEIQKKLFDLQLKRAKFYKKPEGPKKGSILEQYGVTEVKSPEEIKKEAELKAKGIIDGNEIILASIDLSIKEAKAEQDALLNILNEMDSGIFDILGNDPTVTPTGDGEGAPGMSKYQIALEEFDLMQNLQKSRIELEIQGEKEKNEALKQLAIERLAFIYDNSDEINTIQQETLFNQIVALRRLSSEINESEKKQVESSDVVGEAQRALTEKQKQNLSIIAASFEHVGDIINATFEEGEDRMKSFLNATRAATIDLISMILARVVAKVSEDTVETFQLAGIPLIPVFAGLAKAALNAAIPKFATGKRADFTGSGGIVSGSGNKDNQVGMFTPNEMVTNQKQQANLLWAIANGGMTGSKSESYLKDINNSLRNKKDVILQNGVAYVVVNGKLTGEKTSL